jgi:hypothetical protein
MLVKTFREIGQHSESPPPYYSAVCIVCILYTELNIVVDDILSAVFYSRGARYSAIFCCLVLPVSANALYFAFSTHKVYSNRGLRLFETYVSKNGIPYRPTYRPTVYYVFFVPSFIEETINILCSSTLLKRVLLFGD